MASYIYSKYRKLPFKFSIHFLSAFKKYGFSATYIDIDDMMYTGSQTFDTLFRYALNIDMEMPEIINRNKSKEYYSILFKNRYLKKFNLKYKLVRLFMSTYSYKKLEENSEISFPCQLVTVGPKIKTLNESVIKTENDIIYLLIIVFIFNLSFPSMTCSYFDYKIADISSTASFPLLTGYIPSSSFINRLIQAMDKYDLGPVDYISDYGKYYKKFKEDIKINKNTDLKFINFIQNCSTDENLIKRITGDEIGFHEEFGILCLECNKNDFDNDMINKCPKTFYKKKIKKRKSVQF